jgi:cysteinyl-tRNA synthetase
VSTDIIRRILQDYYKFDVNFVMNITDVDDKIILAARQQHLLAEWLSKHTEVDADVRETTEKAFTAYRVKNLPLIPENTKYGSYPEAAEKAYGHVLQGKSLENNSSPPGDKEAKVKMHLNTARSATEGLQLQGQTLDGFAAKTSGVLLPYIDSLHGSSVQGKDHKIFTKLTKRYEQRFFDDMAALNVRPPNKLTRVTEYGPQIVDFVKRIQDNGFAYENEGSVYYDTGSWESSGGVYARLEPWNRNDKELQADGEGSLSNKTTAFKRSAADFALWKASKPGEPSWDSPWGEGRPGWHIECSAMASDVLGKQFDIHSGGIDLAFPHHDNELAQSEAYWCEKGHVDSQSQWVNYFLHMGHLSIQGSKMSKSLKNFTTIKEALAQGAWTPRGLRIVFLLGAWRDGLEITGEIVKAGLAWEEKVNSFFIRVQDLQKRSGAKLDFPNLSISSNDTNGNSQDLLAGFDSAKQRFDAALGDSFDTPTAMRTISDLITAYNSTPVAQIPAATAFLIAHWLTTIVHIFGLDLVPAELNQIGWSGMTIPREAEPFITPLAVLRDSVRSQAMQQGQIDVASLSTSEIPIPTSPAEQPYATAYTDFQRRIEELSSTNAPPKDYLSACDHLRDTTLWNLSIYLEDRETQPSLVRPLSQSLRQDRQEREALATSKSAAKEKAKAAADAADKERLERGRLSHLEMFRTSEFSAWDEEGLPVKDAEGKEVAKSRGKKLRKEWERQKKLHEGWVAAGAAGK